METSKIKLRHPDIHLIFKWRFKGGFSRMTASERMKEL